MDLISGEDLNWLAHVTARLQPTVRLQLCRLIRAKYSSLCTNHILGNGNRPFQEPCPFPSALVPLFQKESKCETFIWKWVLHAVSSSCKNSHSVHMKGFALRLALKQRHKGTRKWPNVVIELEITEQKLQT